MGAVELDITSLSSKNIKFVFMYVLMHIFDPTQLMSSFSPPARYTLATFSASNNPGLTYSNSAIRIWNTMIGLVAFHIQGDNFFDYNTFAISGVSANANSSNNFLTFKFDLIAQ